MEVELPWTEKYRSKKLDDNIVGQTEIVKRLKAYVKQKNMPNLLFAGPPGVGKTLCAIALANEMFGESFSQNFMELNASDERGIDVVREQIKSYAATLPFGGIKFKIIFLDEADALTREAQNALRRTMENTSATTRFILSANYSSKIIEPIQSRCALFRFRPLSEQQITERIKHIAQKEKVHVAEDGYQALVYSSEGDMRRAINFLQTATTLGEKVTEDTIYKVAAKARPKEVKELIELAMAGKFENARKKLDALLYEYGLSGEDVILQIYREIIGIDMDQRKKVELLDRIGEYNFRLTEGANERIQLEALLAYLVLMGQK
jgi:replication factor C small subunit